MAKEAPTKVKIEDTIVNLQILVDGAVTSREIPKNGDRPARTIYSQPAILVGSKPEIAFEKTSSNLEDVLETGVYQFSNQAFRMGRYNLELNPYAPWVKIGLLNEKQAAKFATEKSDLSVYS